MKKENKCEHWWGTEHDFSKWTVEGQGDLLSHLQEPPTRCGFWIKQKRACNSCGFTEVDYKEIY